MGYLRLTLREALASDRLEDFVRQEEARGVELAYGSDLERALALLITQRRSEDRSFTAALEKKIAPGQSRPAAWSRASVQPGRASFRLRLDVDVAVGHRKTPERVSAMRGSVVARAITPHAALDAVVLERLVHVRFAPRSGHPSAH